MIAEHADVRFYPFVIVFHLSLCLWVIGCGEALIDVQGLEEASGIIGCECGSPIRIVDPGYTM